MINLESVCLEQQETITQLSETIVQLLAEIALYRALSDEEAALEAQYGGVK